MRRNARPTNDDNTIELVPVTKATVANAAPVTFATRSVQWSLQAGMVTLAIGGIAYGLYTGVSAAYASATQTWQKHQQEAFAARLATREQECRAFGFVQGATPPGKAWPQ
jgi:hypothetical protein